MTEFVRVKQKETGHELSVPTSHAEASDGYSIVDKPAVDSAGRPLPPKYREQVDKIARRKRSAAPATDSRHTPEGQQAEIKKETD